jgi:hypothetical protein
MASNPYQVTVDLLTAIDNRVNSGTATAQDLSYMAAGIAALAGNSDLQTIVSGMLSTSTTALNNATTNAVSALSGTTTSLSTINTALSARLNQFNYGAAVYKALPSTHTSSSQSGVSGASQSYIQMFWNAQRPYVLDQRTNRIYMAAQNLAYISTGGAKIEWGYFDAGMNWNVIIAQTNAGGTPGNTPATAQYNTDCYSPVPLMNQAQTVLSIGLLYYPGYNQTGTATMQPYNGTSLLSTVTFPFSCTAVTNGHYSRALVYDTTLQCLYIHNNTNALKLFSDGTVVDSSIMSSGSWTQAAWSTAFSNRSRYIDLSGDVEAVRSGDKYIPGGYIFQQFSGHQNNTLVSGGVYQGTNFIPSSMYAYGYNVAGAYSNNGYGITYFNTPLGATNYGTSTFNADTKSMPFFVISSSAAVSMYRMNTRAKNTFGIVPYYTTAGTIAGNTPYAFLEGMEWSVSDNTGVSKYSGFSPFAQPTVQAYAYAASTTAYYGINEPQAYFIDPFNGWAGLRYTQVYVQSSTGYPSTIGHISKL